jgi:hypothetical protein
VAHTPAGAAEPIIWQRQKPLEESPAEQKSGRYRPQYSTVQDCKTSESSVSNTFLLMREGRGSMLLWYHGHWQETSTSVAPDLQEAPRSRREEGLRSPVRTRKEIFRTRSLSQCRRCQALPGPFVWIRFEAPSLPTSRALERGMGVQFVR